MRCSRAEGEPAGRGRPRDPAVDSAILGAALRVMAREGYASMTMEGVAAQAGVAKATVYRRYADRADLATAAVASVVDLASPSPTGDVRAAVVAHLEGFEATLERVGGIAMLATLLVEERREPGLLARFRERVIAPRRHALLGLLERGVAEGTVAPAADLEAVVEMLVGSYFAHHLAVGGARPDWAPTVVELAWRGLAPEGERANGVERGPAERAAG